MTGTSEGGKKAAETRHKNLSNVNRKSDENSHNRTPSANNTGREEKKNDDRGNR